MSKDLDRAQRQFDLRQRALRVVEEDRQHWRVQWRGYWQRRGVDGRRPLWVSDEDYMRAWGAA